MASLDEEVKIDGVYGGVQIEPSAEVQTGNATNLPVKRGFWSSMKTFWLQDIDWYSKVDWGREIKVELTPKQQKVENELNEFLHQEITWEKFRNFLFKDITFGKKD